MKNTIILLIVFSNALLSFSRAELISLNEEEMDNVSAQGLLEIDKYNYGGNNFYKVTMNSDIYSSINIDRLLLRDSNGDAQIDIENLSINGGDDSNGNSSVSSMRITNPFIEFAFKNDIDSELTSDREIIGVRIGAEDMSGYMSFGDKSSESGINWFTGYMKTGDIRGTIRTIDSSDDPVNGYATDINSVAGFRTGPSPPDFTVTGLLCISNAGGPNCGNAGFFDIERNGTFNVPNAQMTFPSVAIDDNLSDPTVNGPIVLKPGGVTINTTTGRIDRFTISTGELNLPNIPFNMTGTGTSSVYIDWFWGTINVEVELDSSGSLNGLRADPTLTQELRYVHRVGVSGNGFSISAQNRDVQWAGEPAIARQGWWMSISNDIDLGDLALDGVRIPDDSLVAITQAASDYLNQEANRVYVDLGSAILGSITGQPVPTPFLNINFSSNPVDSNYAAPIPVNLTTSIPLGSEQNHITNCWNGAIGC